MTTGTRESLADRIRSGPLSIHDAIQICRSLLSTIEHAHALGVAHGSISVGAIVLDGDRALLGPVDPAAPPPDTPADDVYGVAMCSTRRSVGGRGRLERHRARPIGLVSRGGCAASYGRRWP